MMTTARMMITSAKLSPCMTASTPLIAAAASRMIIIGSAIWPKKRLIRDSLAGSFSLFLPCASSRFWASALLRPFSELSSSARTASFSSQ